MTICAVYGLGSMGMGMATSLVKSGIRTYGFDVNKDAVQRFVSAGGLHAEPESVAGQLDAVILVVLNARQTESILFGDGDACGIVPSLNPGTVVMACATMPADVAQSLAQRCAEAQVLYLDAPISGGSIKAADGALSIMASGEPQAFDAASDVLGAVAERVFRLGDEAGAGSAMKSVNQLLAGVHIAAMAEALTFGMTQGVKPEQFLEVISECAGSSWMLENRAPHIIAGDYTPHSAVNIWLKDLGIVLDTAAQARFGAPLTAAALQQYLAAAGQGLGGEDDAAVAKVYARNAGLTLPGEA